MVHRNSLLGGLKTRSRISYNFLLLFLIESDDEKKNEARQEIKEIWNDMWAEAKLMMGFVRQI